MLKTKYFEMKQLIASLEEISEDTTGEFDSLDDQELQDAQIALEGYQDLLMVNQKFTKQGVKIDESIVSGLLTLASPKINKDPLLKNYSEESVADKAKDFGKWIVEKIKALLAWIKKSFNSLKNMGSKIIANLTNKNWKELINKVKGSEKAEYTISVKTLLSISQPNKKYATSDNLSSSDIVTFDVEAFGSISNKLVDFGEQGNAFLNTIIDNYNSDNPTNLPSDDKFLKNFKEVLNELNKGKIESTYHGKKIIFSSIMPAFYLKDEIKDLLSISDAQEIFNTSLKNEIDGNLVYGFSNKSMYNEACISLIGEMDEKDVMISKEAIINILEMGQHLTDEIKGKFDNIYEVGEDLQDSINAFATFILEKQSRVDHFEFSKKAYASFKNVQHYYLAFSRLLTTNIYTMYNGLNVISSSDIIKNNKDFE